MTSLALARQAIAKAHVAWESGDVVQCKLLAETAWEAAERAGDERAEAVKLSVANFIMNAWAPAAMKVAIAATSAKDRATVMRFIRDEYERSADWFVAAAARGVITATATGVVVTVEKARAVVDRSRSELARTI